MRRMEGYPASFFLFLYLYNHFGQEKFLKKVLESKESGWANILAAAKSSNPSIESEIITRNSILRHFAVSVWMNDMFSAKCALFFLDRNYEALRVSASIKPVSKGSTVIQYGSKLEQSTAQEIYSIMSYSPFKIKTAEPQDNALVSIYIFE